MFFDVQQFSLKRKGRFAKCWLAATCPKQFRKFVNRSEVDNIEVTLLCESILEKVFEKSVQHNGRLSLHLAAQLTYGTVCIYQQQVDSLYEHVSRMMSVRTCLLFQPCKRKALADATAIFSAKRPRIESTGSVATVISRMISDFHESVAKDVEMLDQSDLNSKPYDAVTLREAISEHIDRDGIAGFDVLTEAERMDFLYGNLSPNERQRCIDQETGMLIVVAEAHEPPPDEILCSQKTVDEEGCTELPDYSYRSAAARGDTDENYRGAGSAYKTSDNTSSHSNAPTNPFAMEVDNQSIITPTVQRTPLEPLVKTAQSEYKLCDIIPHKPRAHRPKKRVTIIDAITKIPVSETTDPNRYKASQRCWGPIDEIPDKTDILMRIVSERNPATHHLWVGSMPFKRMVHIGENTQMASVLCGQYQRRFKARRYVESLNEDWVMQMCGELPKQRVRKMYPPRNVDRTLGLNADELEDIDINNRDSNSEVNCPLRSNSDDTHKPHQLSLNNNTVISSLELMTTLNGPEPEGPPFLNIEHQLDQLLQSLNISEITVNEVNSLQPDSHSLRTYRELHDAWGTKGMLEKLIHLWRLGIKPIDMGMLMRSAADGPNVRQCAALAFYTLLDLNKIGLVELHKEHGWNRIRDVSKTSKLGEMLDLLDA